MAVGFTVGFTVGLADILADGLKVGGKTGASVVDGANVEVPPSGDWEVGTAVKVSFPNVGSSVGGGEGQRLSVESKPK